MTDIAERHCYQNHPCTGLQSRRTALRRTVLSGGSIAGDFQRIARLDSRSRISDDLKPYAIADRPRHQLDRRRGRGCRRTAKPAGEIGRASCRASMCQYVELSVADVTIKKKN